MLRFSYILVTGLFLAILALYRLSNCAKNEDYTEDQRYAEAIRTVKLLKNRGRIHTEVFGEEYLPKENGYILYANHQGKYDALGILYGHSKPLSILMDYDKSKTVLVTQFIDTLRGIRLKMNDPKQQIKALNQLAKEVKEGRRYLIFPEGKYSDNRNRLQEFSSGCFRCAKKAACPIVPVCIIDSWKPFGINSIKPVTTQVHFLQPIEYTEYSDLKPAEIADLIKGRIAGKLMERIGEC